ncbi:SPOR domain-containing protein [Marinomonas sp. THO17]|uniref:SPOR domain-containing protein n=1 Tax=Marinomonas sp. THO17 TaxID=3149048 RepID=UPI00336BB5AB
MRKTIIIYFNIMLLGIILVLYLPSHINTKYKNNRLYTVDADSLISPYPLSSMHLPAANKGAKYTLQVGLHRELGQATDQAQRIEFDAPLRIIKAKDHQKEWFLILVGPYSNKFKAEQAKQALQDEGISSRVSLWPSGAQ